MKKISILDYGLGNIHSISNAIKTIGGHCELVSKPEDVVKAERLIVPGVGAFGDGANRIIDIGLSQAIDELKAAGVPIMGICLGMQLLFSSSEESEGAEGLDYIDGKVKHFPDYNNYKIPQIQWNRVKKFSSSRLLAGLPDSSYFYFLHSYYVEPKESQCCFGVTEYSGLTYCSVVEQENIVGTQFHPEKSGESGLKVLENFIGLE